jgi:hypothetical protein
MTTVKLTLTLPDDIAQYAEAAGLLRPEEIPRLICLEVERARSPVYDAPVLTEEQINAGIARFHRRLLS